MVQPLPKHRAREYETIFIAHPDTNAEGIEQIAGRLTETISRLDGKLLKAENWGKRRLAYPIHKQQKGVYVYLRYIGYSDLVHEMERNMRMLEPVIKYLTVKLDEDVNPEARPVREEDISFKPQFEDEPDYPESHAAHHMEADTASLPDMHAAVEETDSSEEDMHSDEDSIENDFDKDGESDDEDK